MDTFSYPYFSPFFLPLRAEILRQKATMVPSFLILTRNMFFDFVVKKILLVKEKNLMLVRWLVFLHVLSAITFFLSHGATAAMIFKLRTETVFVRIRAMLDLSASTFRLYMFAFFVMGVTGLIMPFLTHIWDRIYIWLSIVLLLFVVVWMGLVNEKKSSSCAVW
jgi:hypothetical protein